MKEVIFNRRNELLRVPLAKAMFYEAFGNYCYGVFPNKQKVMDIRKPRLPMRGVAVAFVECPKGLLAETQLLDDGTIALDVRPLEVGEETTTLTYEFHK